MKDLGTKVKAMREMRGFSQNELARRVGVKQATVSRLEAGVAKEMRSEAFGRLAKELGVSSDFLLGKTNMPHAEDILHDNVEAKMILEQYIELSLEGRMKLVDYAAYLCQTEKKSGKKRSEKQG